MSDDAPSIGAIRLPGGRTRFRVWAPQVTSVALKLDGPPARLLPMARTSRDYFEVTVPDLPDGSRYWYQLDGERLRPDPASRSQPDGVHGASAVIDPSTFRWSSPFWRAPALEQYVIYELHTGTFTAPGTFDAAIAELDRLRHLGFTAIELMPINEFPGERNWGYDGAYPFAAQSSYGGPAGFARFVDACHQRELAVILDVVFNHFGPEGAYAGEFGHYYSDRYRTLWGNALNFDGPGSDEVRRFFIESALYWLRELHIDAFRVDAIHAILDQSAYPFLRQLTETIHREARMLGRTAYLIAESDLNDPRVIQSRETNGLGFDAQWSDDFHHALHTALTQERDGIYRDFDGVADLKRAFERGFVYIGQYSGFRDRSHGTTPGNIRPEQLVVCDQNHDQIGNRAFGDRLAVMLSFEQMKLSAVCTLLSPYIPLVFMGEEYGESAPFQFFTSHTDPDLAEAVRRGRAKAFEDIHAGKDVPDPQASETFIRSKLNPKHRDSPDGRALQDFHRELLRLRRELPALAAPSFTRQDVGLAGPDDRVVVLHRRHGDQEALILLNFTNETADVRVPNGGEHWRPILDSSTDRWGGNRTTTGDTVIDERNAIEVAPWGAMLVERIASATVDSE
jgi:maltooligosyltrehalose trehalohydrolase